MNMDIALLFPWLSIALLTGGLARTRGRSPWIWFLAAALAGPLGIALLLVLPARPQPPSSPAAVPTSMD